MTVMAHEGNWMTILRSSAEHHFWHGMQYLCWQTPITSFLATAAAPPPLVQPAGQPLTLPVAAISYMTPSASPIALHSQRLALDLLITVTCAMQDVQAMLPAHVHNGKQAS